MSVAPAFQKVLMCCTTNDYATEGSEDLADTLDRKVIKAYMSLFHQKSD